LAPWFMIKSNFEFRFEFTEIFNFKILPCYGPLQLIVLWATCNWGEFGYAYGQLWQIWLCIWATAANLDMRNGPLRRMKPYGRNLWQFPCYGTEHGIWLHAMGHSAGFILHGQSTEFGSALQNGSECQTNYTKSF
jgi:hypothetical protein